MAKINSLLFIAVLQSLILQIACLSTSPKTTQLCRSEEKTALLEFSSHFSYRNLSGSHFHQPYYVNPETGPWRSNAEDCCDWNAVSCSLETGHITGLSLESYGLQGNIPLNSSLFNLVHLEVLYLNGNNFNNSRISPLFGNLRNLTTLDLMESNFSGVVPDEIFQLPKLKRLDLSGNSKLTGKIPSIINATQLEFIDLFGTGFTGELPDSIGELKSLYRLELASCRFSGSIPDSIGNLTELHTLNVSHNNFSGEVPSSISNLNSLTILDLSYNNLEGPVLHMISNLTYCSHLDLSRNHFNETIDLKIFEEFDYLSYLDLSYSGLSLTSTNDDSSFLPYFPSIYTLRLSSCNLSINILKNISAENRLEYVDLSNNNIGEELDSSICNLDSLAYLDLSHNRFSGLIPNCLGNISFSMLNLQSNSFHGKIPESFGYAENLQLLDLSNNLLEGKLPRSLINCSRLEVLNLGGNLLRDDFPFWLGYLSSLKVLILRDNKISGKITWRTKNKQDNFANLNIIDMSRNELSGTLPSKYFKNWNSMMTVDEEDALTYAYVQIEYKSRISNRFKHYIGRCSPITQYCGSEYDYYYYSLNITNKGSLLPYQKILTAMKVVDFSCNKFHGIFHLLSEVSEAYKR